MASSVLPSYFSSHHRFAAGLLPRSLQLTLSTRTRCIAPTLQPHVVTARKGRCMIPLDENKLCAQCLLPHQKPLRCVSAVAFPVLSPLPLVIESPVGYSTRTCLDASRGRRFVELDPFAGGGEEMWKSAVLNKAGCSLPSWSVAQVFVYLARTN